MACIPSDESAWIAIWEVGVDMLYGALVLLNRLVISGDAILTPNL